MVCCDLGSDDCSRLGTDVYGIQLELIGGYRWPMGTGNWGMSVGAAISGGFLTPDISSRSALCLGGSGVRLVLDF